MTDLYTSQRAMRNMRRAAMQRGVIAILDVGTSKIACLILRFDGPDRLREQQFWLTFAFQHTAHGVPVAKPQRSGEHFEKLAVGDMAIMHGHTHIGSDSADFVFVQFKFHVLLLEFCRASKEWPRCARYG